MKLCTINQQYTILMMYDKRKMYSILWLLIFFHTYIAFRLICFNGIQCVLLEYKVRNALEFHPNSSGKQLQKICSVHFQFNVQRLLIKRGEQSQLNMQFIYYYPILNYAGFFDRIAFKYWLNWMILLTEKFQYRICVFFVIYKTCVNNWVRIFYSTNIQLNNI